MVQSATLTPEFQLFDIFRPPQPSWKVFVFPGGQAPVFGGDTEAGAFDLFTRAIVSLEQDSVVPGMRKTIYDFSGPCAQLAEFVQRHPAHGWVYLLPPGKSVRIGVGIAIELPRNQVGYIHPRGSTSNSQIELFGDENRTIQVKNGAVPIDPDFHGEPSAVVYNDGNTPYPIFKNRRIVQLVREIVAVDTPIVEPYVVLSTDQFRHSRRGVGQNGSTGL